MHTKFWSENDGKKPLKGHRNRWEDNIRMDLKELDREGVGWMNLAHVSGPVAGPCEYSNDLRVP